MDEPTAGHAGGRGRQAAGVLAGMAAVLVEWFALANSRTVTVTYWFVDDQSRLIWVIAVSALLGVLVGWLLGSRRRDGRGDRRRG